MRFFSNDAKETTEGDDEHGDNPAVPQQRVGSPWSDAPADAAAVPADDEAVVTEHNAHDLGGPKSETAEQDRDVDLPLDERDNDFEQANVNESTVTSPDAPADEPADAELAGSDEDPALRDEGAFDEPLAVDPVTDEPLDEPAEVGHSHENDAVEDHTVEGDTVEDHTVGGDTFGEHTGEDEPEVVSTDGDSTTYASAAADDSRTGDDTFSEDDTVREDPTPADTADTAPVIAAVPVPVAAAEDTPALEDTPAAEETPAFEETPAVVAVDAPAKPGTVAEKSVEALFGAEDAAAFKDRWRDVQLRFVDSPKDAAAEAAGLVDEAVDKLTASLKSQKDGLLSDSDDTEKLRVELRGYREILNKVLAL